MRISTKIFAVLAASLLIAGAVACGDDDTDAGSGGNAGGDGGGNGGDGGNVGGDGGGGTGGGNDDEPLDPCSGAAQDVGGTFNTDQSWGDATCAKSIRLTATVFITAPATLNISKGTRVTGAPGAAIVIARDAKINAIGTRNNPIVMTSAQAAPSRGDFGGLVILGNATINAAGGTAVIEGFPEGTDNIEYGGNNDADNSGTIRYVRVEFGGTELTPDNEINGFTFGGVGSGTTVEYIQAHAPADDGIEFFGGTVNVKYAIVSQGNDDLVDWDAGYRGNIQYLIVQAEEGETDSGFESDNNEDDNDATPRSNPTIWNLTSIGSGAAPGGAKASRGMVLRLGTSATIRNAIIAYWPDNAIDIRNTSTVANLPTIQNTIFFQNRQASDAAGMFAAETGDGNNDGGFVESTYITDAANNNRIADPDLANPLDLDAPDFAPASPITEGAATPSGGFFDASANFIGAIGSDDWTEGWTAFPEPSGD